MTCITNGGSVNGILNYQNADFSRTSPVGANGNILNQNGQLWIGRTTPSPCGATIGVGNITSTDGSINVINGAASIDIRGAAQGFQPNVALQVFDDFIGASSGNQQGEPVIGWYNLGNNVAQETTGTINNPGIWSWGVQANPQSGLAAIQDNGSNVSSIVLGGGVTTVNWVVNLTSLSAGGNTYRFTAGLADGVTIAAASDTYVNGVYFAYTDSVNAGQWQLKSTASSTTTTVNTTSVVTTGFVTLSIVINAAGTSVSYYVNGVLVGTAITTNIPTAALIPFFQAFNTAGSIPIMEVDLFWLTIALSNPRPGPTAGTAPATLRQILSYTATPISYQVLGTDAIIGVTSTGSARTITMPNANLITGQVWMIKDESGGASTNNITISGNGKNIDGSATFVISTNYGSVDLYYNGTQFYLI